MFGRNVRHSSQQVPRKARTRKKRKGSSFFSSNMASSSLTWRPAAEEESSMEDDGDKQWTEHYLGKTIMNSISSQDVRCSLAKTNDNTQNTTINYFAAFRATRPLVIIQDHDYENINAVGDYDYEEAVDWP
jgi:hypothetical protein